MPRASRTRLANWWPVADGIILAIDQGTGSSKSIAVDAAGRIISSGAAPLSQSSPRPGWVEQDPRELIESLRAAMSDALGAVTAPVVAVGISNQRESLVAWDRVTGEPVTPVISWQDRRTVELAQRMSEHDSLVRRISGLPLDPMFSALKASWIVQEYPQLSREPDRYCLGTIDAWMRFAMTGTIGIESGNASRTSLVDLSTGQWSPELLELFGIPEALLPQITDSAGSLGIIRDFLPGLEGVPICGILGDSHAALFSHAGWRAGVAKATYGTGSSVMAIGDDTSSDSGLCRTIAWRLPQQAPQLALEANILSVGSTLTWLADVLGTVPGVLADEAAEDSGEVFIVPAFNGLGAPWWDAQARAVLTGMTLGTTRAHLARAVLDSMILQVNDVLTGMARGGVRPATLIADGGITANRNLMARQASVSGMTVQVAQVSEASALGAAHAAGLGSGIWTLGDLESLDREYVTVDGSLSRERCAALLSGWADALERARRSPAQGS